MNKKNEQQASLALSGADSVQQRLLWMATLGPFAVEQQVYAIKSRVKRLDSLVAKVAEKKKRRKDYDASKVTDIVGIRFICLYARELVDVFHSLISMISLSQSDNIKIMKGNKIDDCIEEIIIFQSGRHSDVYESIFYSAKRMELSEYNKKKVLKVRMEKNGDEKKPYSSIHIVANAEYRSGLKTRNIPVEFQIRTVFEDVWGEIDHSLEYKIKTLYGDIPVRHKALHTANRDRLSNLKEQLDLCGGTAEEIRDGYGYLVNALLSARRVEPGQAGYFNLSITQISEPYERFLTRENEEDLPDSIRDIIASLADIREISNTEIRNNSEADKITKKIVSFIDKLEKSIHNTDAKVNDEWLYFLKMEIGLLHIWVYSILKHFYPNRVSSAKQNIDAAEKIYSDLESKKDRKDDAILYLRLAQVMLLKGANELAEAFVQKSVMNLSRDNSISDVGAVTVLTYAGYVMWTRRIRLFDFGMEKGSPLMNREVQS
ncbi:MAG: RelA/SpoT domain-containing protein [Ahrensia sp.]